MKFWYNTDADIVIARVDDLARLNDFETNQDLADFNIKILTADIDLEQYNVNTLGADAPGISGVDYIFVENLSTYGTITPSGDEFIFVAT